MTLIARQLRRAAGAALAAAFLAAFARAEPSGGAFLTVQPSVRAYALGVSNVTAVGAQALGSNPANLGILSRRFELYTAYANQYGGSAYGQVAAAFDPGFQQIPIDALGISVTSLQTTGLQSADASGNLTGGTFGAGDMAFAAAFSGHASDALRFGATGKIIQSQIDGVRSNVAAAVDFGLTATFSTFSKKMSAGFNVDNLGAGLRYVGQTDPLPTSVNAGLAVPLGPVLGVLEFSDLVNDGAASVGIGAEYGIGPAAFRLGVATQIGNPNGSNLAQQDQSGASRLLVGLTAGVGLRMGFARLDYAVSQQAVDFGMTQRLGLTIDFGRTPSRDSAPHHYDPQRPDWYLGSGAQAAP